MIRIDAHHHLWRTARADYGWLTPDAGALYRDFEPEDLAPLLRAVEIDRTVIVQAAETAAETDFLLNVARRYPWIAGVVGWVDLAARDAESRVAERAHDRLLLGLRPMLQDMPDRTWILRQEVQPGLAAMAQHQLVFDALVREDQVGSINMLAQAHPELSIILDHAGKPAIGRGERATWRAALKALARYPNVTVKLSGLLTESPPGADAALLRPYVQVLFDEFEPDRVIWGSDWPVLTLAGSYAGWIAITEELIAPLGDRDRQAIMGGNAARIYKIGDKTI